MVIPRIIANDKEKIGEITDNYSKQDENEVIGW